MTSARQGTCWPRVEHVVLWGATGQAKVLRECLGAEGGRLVAVFDNDVQVPAPFPDVPLFAGPDGFERWLAQTSDPSAIGCLVAIGGERGRERVAIQERLAGAGLQVLTVAHARAFVASDAVLGTGSQVLAQAAVCVQARLGRACIVNTGASVDHECRLGDGVHVCPGAHLAGLVEVGDHAMIGTGATVLPRVRIGAGARVGAGAVVTRDVPAGVTVVGNPARPWPGARA